MTIASSRTRGALSWSADPYTRALRAGGGPLYLRRTDGRRLPLEMERWCAGPDAADRTVLGRCVGRVLDIGCGPGRMVVALARCGRLVLGIDTVQAAVDRTRRRGGPALLRSVFGDVPGAGRWGSVLLLDGNIGIGGDPAALLARVRELTAPGGLLVAEAASGEAGSCERFEVRLDDGAGDVGPVFPWAKVGQDALRVLAEHAGWRTSGQWTAHGRGFVVLRSGG